MSKLRLDKLLSHMGYGSRKEVRQLIKNGSITVNDILCRQPETVVDTQNDRVAVGQTLLIYEKYCYLMMNKPAGYLSANTDCHAPTVMDLLPEPYDRMTLFVAGRLDKDTEGLLLLTNDGQFAHNMLSPKKHVPKTYYALIDGKITADDAAAFTAGITLDDGLLCQPAQLEIITNGNPSEILLTITEGKFHQVKRMFAARGHTVLYLKRQKIGKLTLDETLSKGSIKKLTDDDLVLIGAERGV